MLNKVLLLGDAAKFASQKNCETNQGVFRTEEITNVEKIDGKHSKIYYIKNNKNFEAIVNSNREEEELLIASCASFC